MRQCFQLHFDGGASWDLLRSAASRVLEVLGAPPAAWTCAQREVLPDRTRNGGAFRARWTRPLRGSEKAEVVEEAANGSGNPRDGYGYDNRWRLEADKLVLMLSSSSWEPHPRDLSFLLCADDPATVDEVRWALREAFGKRRDRSAEPYVAAHNVRAARDLDRERAYTWMQEALRRNRPKPDFGGWHQLLLEREALEGPGEESLAQRMRDVPGDVDAWKRALSSPPTGWTRERVARVLERIAPWKAGALTPPWNALEHQEGMLWFQMDDGLGATPAGRARIDVPLLRSMAPALLEAPTLTFDAVQRGNRAASSTVQAVWPGRSRRGVVLARVTREARQYGRGWSKRSVLKRLQASPQALVQHHWLWIRKAPVCVQMVTRTLRVKGREVHLGHALGVTPSFLDEVMGAIRMFCPFRWIRMEPANLFNERKPRKLYVEDGEKPTIAKLHTVLARAGAATPEVLNLLKPCHCRSDGGDCEHDRALIDVERRFEQEMGKAKTQRERFLVSARLHALQAASQHRRTGRVDGDALLRAVRDLARSEACV